MDGNMDPRILLIFVVIGIGYAVAPAVSHAAKKTAHGIVHVVTLGKK
jgi:hypothetical protein